MSVRRRFTPHISIAKFVYIYIRTGVATVVEISYIYVYVRSTKGLTLESTPNINSAMKKKNS